VRPNLPFLAELRAPGARRVGATWSQFFGVFVQGAAALVVVWAVFRPSLPALVAEGAFVAIFCVLVGTVATRFDDNGVRIGSTRVPWTSVDDVQVRANRRGDRHVVVITGGRQRRLPYPRDGRWLLRDDGFAAKADELRNAWRAACPEAADAADLRALGARGEVPDGPAGGDGAAESGNTPLS
jgi:hypothetical protein